MKICRALLMLSVAGWLLQLGCGIFEKHESAPRWNDPAPKGKIVIALHIIGQLDNHDSSLLGAMMFEQTYGSYTKHGGEFPSGWGKASATDSLWLASSSDSKGLHEYFCRTLLPATQDDILDQVAGDCRSAVSDFMKAHSLNCVWEIKLIRSDDTKK